MIELYRTLNDWRRDGEEIAIATLVCTRGSTPRLPGARLAVTRSGRMEGSVSGGCVEGDVFERAMQVLDSGQPQLTEYGISDEMGFEVGLSCGGTIDVFIEPYVEDNVSRDLRALLEADQPAVLALAITGEAAGQRLLVRADGLSGTIDSAVDAAVIADARALLTGEGGQLRTYPVAGGELTVFLEAFTPPARMLIVGATHTAIPLVNMANRAGFKVTVVDARSLFATKERFPDANEVLRDWPDRALAGLGLDEFSYVVILTHDPKFDLPALEFALRSPARYIGAMGSRKTHAQRRERLREMGFSDAEISRVHAPIGLDLGARSPAEVAVAVLAEVIAVRYGRRGGFLTGEPGK